MTPCMGTREDTLVLPIGVTGTGGGPLHGATVPLLGCGSSGGRNPFPLLVTIAPLTGTFATRVALWQRSKRH